MRGFTAGIALLAGVAAIVAAPLADACTGIRVLLQDNFQIMTTNWGGANDNVALKNGAMTVSPSLGANYIVLNQGNLFTDMTACVDVAIVQGGPQMVHTFGGIAFWAADINNLYNFVLGPSGTYSIARYVDGRIINIAGFTGDPAIKAGLNQVNHLRVVTRGNQATLFVNDKQIAVISGQPPQGGGEIGFMALSGPATRDVYAFSHLKITN